MLISPLCAMRRYGCARSQVGKVFVLNREWTSARRLRRLLFPEVQEELVESLGQGEALVDDRLGGKAREKEPRQPRFARATTRALADHEQRPLEDGHRAHAPDEELLEGGHRERATGPNWRLSTGTSRQPMTFWL